MIYRKPGKQNAFVRLQLTAFRLSAKALHDPDTFHVLRRKAEADYGLSPTDASQVAAKALRLERARRGGKKQQT